MTIITWTGRELNPQFPACQTGAIPLDHQPLIFSHFYYTYQTFNAYDDKQKLADARE